MRAPATGPPPPAAAGGHAPARDARPGPARAGAPGTAGWPPGPRPGPGPGYFLPAVLGVTSRLPDQSRPALTVLVCARPAVWAASPISLGST